MFRKNVASQFIHFQGVDATTGGIKSGVTWTVRRYIDGTAAAGGGTVTEDGTTGWYKYAMSQADTNGNNIGFNFTGSGAIPQTVTIVTTACDPTTATNFGITSLPTTACTTNASLLTSGTGTDQLSVASGRIDIGKLLGTAWLTPGTAGTPDVNVKLWNALTTVALPLVPTVAGRTLDCSAGGEAGVDWANIGSPTTSNALTNTSIITTQKVDVDTIKTNPVVNAGTVTFTTNSTVASTTNITSAAGCAVSSLGANVITAAATATDFGTEIATAIWTDTTAGDFTTALSIGKSIMNGVTLGTGLTINAYTGNTVQTGDAFARIGVAGVGLTNLGDTRIANLDATVSSRGTSTLTQTQVSGGAYALNSSSFAFNSAFDFTTTQKTSLNSATPAVTVSDKAGFSLTSAYDAAKTASQVGDIMKVSSGTGANQISLSSGLVTVGTNSDKTGYSLTQTFPSNFSSLAITAAGLVAITSNRKKGATATFEFVMTDSTTGAVKTGLTVASVISKDGGAVASTTNSVTEIGLGQYQLIVTATEMTANNIFIQFTSTGAITYNLSIQTQP